MFCRRESMTEYVTDQNCCFISYLCLSIDVLILIYIVGERKRLLR